VISALAASGIGTLAFQRALAVEASKNLPVSAQMIADAEWVAGITLSDEQRRRAAKTLNDQRKRLEQLRKVSLDYSIVPPFVFSPLVTPESAPYAVSAEIGEKEASQQIEPVTPTSDEELAFLPIRTLAALLRNKHVSSMELTKLYLERLHRYDPLLKCVVTFTDELALKQAQQADAELARGQDRGLLHGIPWGAKDLFALPDYPTTWGAWQFRDRVIDDKAAVIERLEAAGAVLVAKLATGAFAGENFWWRGSTRNPWNPHQGASASSSGPASATAAGLVGFSIGTETMGSIIFPSARCGVVGLRPTFGRVSRHGCMQLCWSLDKVGPICRYVDDCGLVLTAIHGADPPRDRSSVDRPFTWPSGREPLNIRVGYVEGDCPEDDLAILRERGFQLIPIKLPTLPDDIEMPIDVLEGTVTVESSSVFELITLAGGPKGVKLWPPVWGWGHFLTGIDYLKYGRIRTILMERSDKLMQLVDVCIGDEGRTITNLTGQPKIVLPREFKSKDGFDTPVPQAFFGRNYDEATLLTVADAYQSAVNVHSRRPPLAQFLAKKETFLEDEEFPDVTKLYE
jgi:Asp-tRNA(Asn)/Glu-tRNA(Gln) amidotransferase A subunit family amidase